MSWGSTPLNLIHISAFGKQNEHTNRRTDKHDERKVLSLFENMQKRTKKQFYFCNTCKRQFAQCCLQKQERQHQYAKKHNRVMFRLGRL